MGHPIYFCTQRSTRTPHLMENTNTTVSSIQMSDLTSVAVWRPLLPQRPPKLHLEATCTQISEVSELNYLSGYQFEVQRIKIHNDSKCGKPQPSVEETRGLKTSSGSTGSTSLTYTSEHLKTSPNLHPFCIPNVDVSNFLNLHSQYNHEEFCLAYVFTYRDFTGGTLGLAWVASASGASGGICETYKRYLLYQIVCHES